MRINAYSRNLSSEEREKQAAILQREKLQCSVVVPVAHTPPVAVPRMQRWRERPRRGPWATDQLRDLADYHGGERGLGEGEATLVAGGRRRLVRGRG